MSVARQRENLSSQPRWELYRLLADPTRVRLLALTAVEELAVSELAVLLREGQPKVSRHAAALREAGLLSGRKQGTWVLLRLTPEADLDSVVADALHAGREALSADGTLARVADIIAQRDMATREFFARGGRAARSGPPEEVATYLKALAPLIAARETAIDVGTGDGALLEVLAPIFTHVIALDRSDAQLDLARERAAKREFRNISFICGECDGDEVRDALSRWRKKSERTKSTRRSKFPGADAVFAARVLHHAPVPHRTMQALVQLARPPIGKQSGGLVLVLDYEAHRDEGLREKQADLWLGFEPNELISMAQEAGLSDIQRTRLPQAWCGEGPDRHLTWQLLSGRRSS